MKVLYNSDTQVFPMYQVLNFLMLDLSLFNRKIDGNFCLTSQREREGQTSIVILASHLGMPSLVGYSPQGCRVGRDYSTEHQVACLLLKSCRRKQAETTGLAALLLTKVSTVGSHFPYLGSVSSPITS